MNRRRNCDVLVVSPLPPVLGGYTVHVARSLSLIRRAGISVKVFDYENQRAEQVDAISAGGHPLRTLRLLLLTAIRLRGPGIVHVHVAAMRRFGFIAPVFFMLFSQRRFVISLHAGRIVEASEVAWRSYLTRWILRRCDAVVCVSEAQAAVVKDRWKVEAERVVVSPAFLPEEPDAEALEMFASMADGRRVIVISGFLDPIYDIDTVIRAIDRMSGTEYRWIFAFYGKTDRTYEARITKALSGYSNVQVLRNLKSSEFVALLASCDVYVRATTEDGDAVAIREALSLGKVVIATDVVVRPEGCHLFGVGDDEALAGLIASAGPIDCAQPNCFEPVIATYRRLLTPYSLGD